MRAIPRIVHGLQNVVWRLTRPMTVGVRLILETDAGIVLVKHTYHNEWYLPGGGVKKGETVEEAARREAMEELGISLGTLRVFGIYTNFREHKSDHIVVFACTDFKLARHTSPEIESVACFPISGLPENVSPGTLRRIEEYREGGGDTAFGNW